MTNRIQAVLFDVGGTLEDVHYDEAIRRSATARLQARLRALDLDPGLSPAGLHAAVASGIASYQAWRRPREVELPTEAVWAEHILAGQGLPEERVRAAADELMLFYETHYYARSLRPEVPAVLEALHEQGYRLGIISNVMSRGLVPGKLAEYGIAHYFDPVVTSVGLGWRKPNARIFEEATRLLGLPPRACAYVGDTVSRDVTGARRAGYGRVIQICSFLTDRADLGTERATPDAVIHDLREVVELLSRPMEGVHAH